MIEVIRVCQIQIFSTQLLMMKNNFLILYFQSGFSQDEMFEYFNCGIDYILIIDHTKSSVENILQQLTQTHTTCFLLGRLTSISKYLKENSFQLIFFS